MADKETPSDEEQEAAGPPFEEEIPDAQITGPSDRMRRPITEGPVAVSYPQVSPKAQNPGKKPGQGYGV